MTSDKPPVLNRQNSETDVAVKSIDQNLKDLANLGKKKKANPYKDFDIPVEDIKKVLTEISEIFSDTIDTTGLAPLAAQKYIEAQKKYLEKGLQNVEDTLNKKQEELLEKRGLTLKDKKLLNNLLELEEFVVKLKQNNSPNDDQNSSQNDDPLDDPLEDLKKSVSSFVSVLDNGIDVSGMSSRDRRAYLRKQNKLSKEEKEEIKDLLVSSRDSILSKKELTKEDRIALQEIKSMQINLKKYGVKQESVIAEFVAKIDEELELSEGKKQAGRDIFNSLLGPLKLITKPFEDLFGGHSDTELFDVVSILGKKAKDEFFAKGKKVKPKRSDIIKSNPEVVWQTEMLLKGKTGSEPSESFLDNASNLAILGSGAAPIIANLSKALPALSALAGFAMAIYDSIKAMGMAEEWDVSKGAAAVGGFLGGTKDGWEGAFQNGIKGALIGFSFGGPIGALVGGVLGMGLGAIGGERISKAIQKIINLITGDGLFTEEEAATISANESYYQKLRSKDGSQGSTLVSIEEQQSIWRKNLSDANRQAYSALVQAMEAEAQKNGTFIDAATRDKKIKARFPSYPIPVNDAILTPQGKLIIPSKDDTIIATKNPVAQKGFDSASASMDLHELSKTIESSFNGRELVAKLQELITIVRDKPFNNVIQTNNMASNSFEALRAVY